MGDIVVVGAGPAGLAAARRASESGASVVLIDDNPATGGQIWRGGGATVTVPPAVKVVCGARVVDAPEPGVLTLETFDSSFELRYERLIVATGARERFLPFPGWTLPHVMGAGGLQALVKSGMPIAGKRVVVAGTGPLLLAVADYLRRHRARVVLVAEQASERALVAFGLELARHPAKLMQALALRYRIGYRTSTWPLAAQPGSISLHREGKSFTKACDYVACGFGLVPNFELAALLGCKPGDIGLYQESSIPNVYCAGEVTGIGGLELSLLEGEIAGYAAAGKRESARPLFAARAKYRRFAAALERTFALREELKNLPQDDTFICRCEDVAFGRVRRCLGWREAKLHTRCGMGPCQGRVCGAAVEYLLGWKPESVRPPVFPARIETLSGPKCPQQ
jgi:NADPH-dependent 2,4-dienoyl-CoA reductase/sulfur reductase-like enzyme